MKQAQNSRQVGDSTSTSKTVDKPIRSTKTTSIDSATHRLVPCSTEREASPCWNPIRTSPPIRALRRLLLLSPPQHRPNLPPRLSRRPRPRPNPDGVFSLSGSSEHFS